LPAAERKQKDRLAAVLPVRALRNWRVRSKLLLLITIPTLVALVLGAVSIATSVQSEVSYQRVEQLADLSSTVTNLATALQNERDQTVTYIAEGDAGRAGALSHRAGAAPNLQNVQQTQDLTNPWVSRMEQELKSIGSSYPVQVQDDAEDVTGWLGDLPQLRVTATTTKLPGTVVLQDYDSVITAVLAIDDNISLGSADATLTGDVRALNSVSQIIEETSIQRGLLDQAFTQGSFGPGVLSDTETAQGDEQDDINQFDQEATQQQQLLFTDVAEGGPGVILVDDASEYEATALASGEAGSSLNTLSITPDEWSGAMTAGTLAGMDKVQQDLVSDTIARASALRKDAIITASGVGAAVLLVLLLALLLTTVVGRSMVRPLRRLRTGALEVAGVRLPETVRMMSESDGSGVPLDIEAIDVNSADEIGEVARAFDQVHREALRLAANEAALRGNVNAMFVNLSRRSQSLVERQIHLIDDLEQGEQDADRLASLFQMDHLATRMRRNSENLLVLAGHDASRRWNQPVALVDVLRAAVSEIEQYERVTLNVQPGIAVRGHAVNDVVHLLAELAENATSFSSAETPVVIAGHLLSSGGVLLDITDQGVGMGAEEMAHANWRLDNPPVVDVAVSRRMGLFVVARLAARHGIRVRLRPAASGGLTALVWLPDEVISHQAEPGMPGLRRIDQGGVIAGLPAGTNGGDASAASTAEQEINAARAPRFASTRAETGGGLGARRIPGAGPHPGSPGAAAAAAAGAAETRPMPAFTADEQTGAVGQETSQRAAPVEVPRAYEPGEAFAAGRTPTVSADDGATNRGSFVWDAGAASSAAGVVVPPAEHVAAENRLPIFEAVESDWFRRGRSGLGGWQPQGGTGGVPEVAWTTPSDQGWEAAAAVSVPSTGGTTDAGLPRRVPQANLVPGAAGQESAQPVPTRSAAATRERFASFQRGSREGRAAASNPGDEPGGDV
jgi:signal transduction histidine kinase